MKPLVVDIELTLNRFGFGFISPNKVQFGFFRIAVWRGLPKAALSFEVNYALKKGA